MLSLGLTLSFSIPSVAQTVKSAPADSNRTTQTGKNPVIIKLEQFKVVKNADGREVLSDAKTVKPGEVIEYRASYTNQDQQPVQGLQATLPIPSSMHYLPKSAKPAGTMVQAATAAGNYGSEPLMQQANVNGVRKTEPVPYSQYRSLRWDVGTLDAGKTYVVSARAQVEGADAKSEAAPLKPAKASDPGKPAKPANPKNTD